jgi:recombination protein RecR
MPRHCEERSDEAIQFCREARTGLLPPAFAGVAMTDKRRYLLPMASPEIDALTLALARLPGLGPRSARRAVLHLMKKRETALAPLLKALERVNDNLSVCSACGNVDTTDPCSVCADPRRDDRLLCVVEEVSDLWALDRSRLFPGRFHVLGGRLSALEGVRPEDLSIDKLLARLALGGIDEVVLAMNATLEGQTTAHYLAERLETFPVRLTQLAHGLPVGGELDYLDEGTLAQALRARRPVA